MKKLFLLLAFISLGFEMHSQGSNYLWAKSAQGIQSDYSLNLVSDNVGNLYVVGMFFSPTITFGSFTLTNANSSGSTPDLFLVKYDPSGNVLWARSAGQNSFDAARSVTIDIAGNIIICGEYSAPSITFGTTTLACAGGSDCFIAKYDPSGNSIWAKSAGGSGTETFYSICADESGNTIVTGLFVGPSINFGSTTLINSGPNRNILIAKYDALGNVNWAKRAGGTFDDLGYNVCCDSHDNIYVSGEFRGDSISFGSTTLVQTPGSPPPSMVTQDAFLVKCDSAGNYLWAKQGLGINGEFGRSVVVDNADNVIWTGSLLGFPGSTCTFGATTLTNVGYENAFIVKYDELGNQLWANFYGGNFYDVASTIEVDQNGNYLITGTMGSPSLTIGSSTLTNNSSTSYNYDLLFLKYDPSGNFIWAQNAGSTADEWGWSGIVDANGSIVLCGNFGSSTVTFGSHTVTNAATVADKQEVFVLKLDNLTGVSELITKNDLVVYPNPSNGILNIKTDIPFSNIQIFNMLGEKVYEKNCNATKEETIFFESATTGIYLIKVEDEQSINYKKIYIQK